MFSVIRHAGYHLGTGSLTPVGSTDSETLAKALVAAYPAWREIRTSSVARTRETSQVLSKILSIPVETDERIGMDGDIGDLLPPTEPHDIIFVTHLPVITKMLRAWSTSFGIDEPALTEIASGYLIDPSARTITTINRRSS